MPNRDSEYRAAARTPTTEHRLPFYARPKFIGASVARLLLVASAPVALVIIDDAAAAFRGPVDGRAEQCAVFWIFGVGLWAVLRMKAEDAALFAAWSAAGAVAVIVCDSWLRAGGSALPPPQAFLDMLLVLVIASLHVRTKVLLRGLRWESGPGGGLRVSYKAHRRPGRPGRPGASS